MKQNRKTTGKSVLAALLFLALMSGCTAADTNPENMDAASEQAKIAGTKEAPAEKEAGSEKEENHPAAEQDLGEEGTLTVTFLDVGQGNAVLVEQDGEYMLIDGGDREYSSFVVSFLKEQGVDELEYVIASHYDADHLNGVVGALNVFPCELVLAPDYTADSRVYDSFLNIIEEKDVALAYPAVGDTYTLGGAEFTVVCPDGYDAPDANDNSVGVRLTYGETSFLICGDAGTGVERRMMESGITLDSDVYLASHHGSNGSSSLAFLQAVSPETVVISAGLSNSYGHPMAEVLENIQSVGAALYRTDLQGTLVAVSDGSTVTWNVPPCTDYRDGETLEAAGAGAEVEGEPASAGAGTEGEPGAASAGEETEGEPGAALAGAEGEPEEAASGAGTEMTGETGEKEVEAEIYDSAEGTGDMQAEYVMNRNTKKFHLPSCASAADIAPENKANFTGSREELIAAGYEPCKRCNP
ncbi:MAG: MBL fold metallo-hydrolase [Roseburia sp.]|nr:MBL fold metallo-hydrolase [Roseburia sp.]